MEKAYLHKKIVGPLKGLSLQHRIPLLICLLLFIVVGLFIAISYFSISKIEGAAATQRVQSLTVQAGLMFSESIDDFVRSAAEAASSEPVRRYFDDGSPQKSREATEVLNRYAGNDAFEYCMLLNNQFGLLLCSNKNSRALTESDTMHLPKFDKGNFKAGYIYKTGDSLYYSVIAPVKINNTVKGYVARCRQIKITSKMLAQFSALAGKGVTLLVGNANGSVWTNLSRSVPYRLPVTAKKAGAVYEYRNEAKTKITGSYEAIPGTPWLVVIEVPASMAFAGSGLFLKWMLIIGAFLIIISLFIAWYMGRNLTRPLNELILAVTTVGMGDKSKPVPVHRTDEVGTLAQSFNSMLQNLETARQATEEQIRAVEHANGELRRLSAHLSTVRENERVNIARELHDQLGQLLTAFKMDVFLLKKKLAGYENPLVAERLLSMESSLDDGVKFVRKLSSELRAGPLEDLGLITALQWYSDNFSQRYSIPVKVNAEPSFVELPLELSLGMFRIFQECLTNVARHARATRIDVLVKEKEKILAMIIADDGKGFDSQAVEKPQTLGLLGMKERAVMMGAELHIFSSPRKGCRVEVQLKLQKDTSTPS
ncbi:MAG: HAMP domain-containing protein [Chitinophagaceae bacterium]|nr:HAMP domain-containing protein [Chitinophagaceae bacterium]